MLQELVTAICDAKGLPLHLKARVLVFTSEGGTMSCCGNAASMDTQRKSLLDGYDDWEFSADLPKSNRHPDVIQDTGMRPESYSMQELLSKSSWLNSPHHTRVEWKKQIPIKEINKGLEQGAGKSWTQIPDIVY
ncbi:reverse transcriptase [Plakobranchus ocellatus]|uniref:Reverse transcriptase n=1 Tax=Plakobranchus ocellatus TaxID=259542 RepID=A0AAV4CY62_9GAST|nr:reverse transcriptase [Plakobranchus ocellatus]